MPRHSRSKRSERPHGPNHLGKGAILLGAIVLGAALLMFGAPHFHTKQKPTCYPPPRIVPVVRTLPERPDTTVLRIHRGQVVIIKGVR